MATPKDQPGTARLYQRVSSQTPRRSGIGCSAPSSARRASAGSRVAPQDDEILTGTVPAAKGRPIARSSRWQSRPATGGVCNRHGLVGRTCWRDRHAALRQGLQDCRLLHPARPNKRARLPPPNTVAGRRKATRRSSPIPRSRRSSTPPRPTTRNSGDPRAAGAAAGPAKHVVSRQSRSPNTVSDGRAITKVCANANVVPRLGDISGGRENQFRLAAPPDRRRRVRQARELPEANISRDRLGKIDLSSWALPGRRDAGAASCCRSAFTTPTYSITCLGADRSRQRPACPGSVAAGATIRTVASLILEHENGAPFSTLNASYASASEYYI